MYLFSFTEYMGPAEVTIMVDSCDSAMYSFYRSFTANVLKYVSVEDNKVKFNAASFCSQVQPMTSYQDLYYVHQSLSYDNIMARKTWTASEIIGDYILHFSNIKSANKFGIVMINDASYEPDLAMISKVAFQQGITLLAMGINSGMGISAQLQAKLNLITTKQNTTMMSHKIERRQTKQTKNTTKNTTLMNHKIERRQTKQTINNEKSCYTCILFYYT